MTNPSEVLLTVQEVAARLRVKPETVTGYIRQRKLKAIDLGGRSGYRIKQEWYEQFVEERKKGAAA